MMPSYEYSYMIQDSLEMGLITGLVRGIPSGIFGIACYVLTALALYTIAKRRGINHPWLSWIPVADMWILGSLSDQYRYVVKGQDKSKRKVLLTLSIISAVLSMVILIAAIVVIGEGVTGVIYGMDPEDVLEDVVGPVLGVAGLALPLAGLSIAQTVISFMALYDVYCSCTPDNSTLFLVLSILFGVTKPFFLFLKIF